MRWKMNKSMKSSWFKVPVKVKQINEYLFSDTVQSKKKKKKIKCAIKADWVTFRLICQDRLQYEKLDSSVNALENFSSTLLGVAEKTIPKTSKQPQRHSVPWFNDSCKVAGAERKQHLQAFTKNPTNSNLSNLRVFRAKARRTIRQNKQASKRTPLKRHEETEKWNEMNDE